MYQKSKFPHIKQNNLGAIQKSLDIHFKYMWHEHILAIVILILMCLLGPFSTEIGTVDISLQTFFVLVIGGILRPVYAFLYVLAYLILGALGFPVFSNYVGGHAALFGATAGFLLAFPFAALIFSKAQSNASQVFYQIMTKGILTHVFILIVGYFWLATSLNWTLVSVLESVQKLIPGMFIKSALAAAVIYSFQKISWRAKS